jgi:hypothetical protein
MSGVGDDANGRSAPEADPYSTRARISRGTVAIEYAFVLPVLLLLLLGIVDTKRSRRLRMRSIERGTESEMSDKVAMITFKQWRVTDDGLECRDDAYDIRRDRLADKREHDKRVLSDWLLQMGDKEWVDIEDFIAAWCAAVLVHRVKLGKIDVAKSIEIAREENQSP